MMNLDEMTLVLKSVDEKRDRLLNIVNRHEEIIILGNGGSSSIASHISEDYTKQLKKRAFTFSDIARLTCYSNDYGYDMAYVKFLDEFVNQDTLVILISSSGNSENIFNCAEYCKNHDIDFIILTGWYADNKIRESFREFCSLDFWIDSRDYGVVETGHSLFLHSII